MLFFLRRRPWPTYCSKQGCPPTVYLDGIVGQWQVDQSRWAAEGPTVQAVDVVPGQVQDGQLLDLPQLRLGHHRDQVAGQVQLAQAALHRVQRPDRDLQQLVVRHPEDLQLGGLKEALGQAVDVVARQIENHEAAEVPEASTLQPGEQVVGEAEPLQLAVHLQGGLLQPLDPVVAEVQVDEAA